MSRKTVFVAYKNISGPQRKLRKLEALTAKITEHLAEGREFSDPGEAAMAEALVANVTEHLAERREKFGDAAEVPSQGWWELRVA